MTTRMIPINQIDAEDRLRTLDPAWVNLLAEEIHTDGLQEPIVVVEQLDGFRLISGARRLAALVQLGRDEIEADVRAWETLPDPTAVRLAEIKSHMLRGDLTALDRAVTIAAWCEIHRAAQEPVKPGRKRAEPAGEEDADELSAKLALNWTDAAQQALNIGRRTVFRSMKIAAIAAETRAAVALLPIADKQSELLLLAEQDAERQAAIVAKLTSDPAEALSVTEAIAILDSVPQARPVPAYEKLCAKVSALKVAQRDAFFNAMASEIDAWQARRATAKTRKAA